MSDGQSSPFWTQMSRNFSSFTGSDNMDLPTVSR